MVIIIGILNFIMSIKNIIDPDEVISKYDFDAIIIKRDVPLEWYLKASKEYSIYYQDDTATIYRRV